MALHGTVTVVTHKGGECISRIDATFKKRDGVVDINFPANDRTDFPIIDTIPSRAFTIRKMKRDDGTNDNFVNVHYE